MPDMILQFSPGASDQGSRIASYQLSRLQAECSRVAIDRAFCRRLAVSALRSLHVELALYPKPGLVSRIDNGSHADMTAATFLRSLFSLRHYFFRIAQAGLQDAPFAVLKQLGIDAERTMLRATAGINTHRGAIFCIGMLCAAIARCRATQGAISPESIRTALLDSWGLALVQHSQGLCHRSHGQQVALRHAISGASEEIALGLPAVFHHALPALWHALSQGRDSEAAQIDALFGLMARINDTNLYHRGGQSGAEIVKARAVAFLEAGGTANPHWRELALECHRDFTARRLSPGGAADLLAATWLVHLVTVDVATGGPGPANGP